MRRGDFDVAHVNGATNIGPVMAALLVGRPVLWHWNDTMVPRPVARILGLLLRLPHCWLIVASTAVVKRYGVDPRTRRYLGVVPPPVSVAANASTALIKRESERDVVIGFVGNLTKAKGTVEYIRTVAALANDGIEVRGVMIGGALSGHDDHLEELHRLIDELGMSGRIDLLGYRNDAQDLIRQFDLVLFPSYSEAAPIVVLQALAHGIPLVATDVGNVAEVVEGLHVPVVQVADVPSMVSAVKEVLGRSNEERQIYASAARARVKDAFSLEAVASRHVECYARIVGCDPRRVARDAGALG